MGFGHEKLHVFRAAVEYVGSTNGDRRGSLEIARGSAVHEDQAQYTTGIDPDTDSDPDTDGNGKTRGSPTNSCYGDPDAARRRIAVLENISVLKIDDAALALAERLVSQRLVPQECAADALHIAIAAVGGIDYLLTWNCKHFANAARRQEIEALVEDAGYACPVICTPEERMEE